MMNVERGGYLTIPYRSAAKPFLKSSCSPRSQPDKTRHESDSDPPHGQLDEDDRHVVEDEEPLAEEDEAGVTETSRD